MITRLVKLTFIKGKGKEFLTVFERYREAIARQPGCDKLELLHDTYNPDIFFTFSIWRTQNDLENYRESDVFKEVWPQVKPYFLQPAEAWSTKSVSKTEPL